MKIKLAGMPEFEQLKTDQDGVGLANLLRRIYFDQDGSKQAMVELVEANKTMYLCWQRPGMSLDDYTREFRSRVQV